MEFEAQLSPKLDCLKPGMNYQEQAHALARHNILNKKLPLKPKFCKTTFKEKYVFDFDRYSAHQDAYNENCDPGVHTWIDMIVGVLE